MGITADDVRLVAFTTPPIGRRGYNEDEVDAFLDRVELTLRGHGGPGAVTAADVHNVAFTPPRFGRRGYDMNQVDAVLDLVETELLARPATLNRGGGG